MPAYVDARPPGLSLDFRPGNSLPVTLVWEDDSLAGRTFSSTLGVLTLDVSVDGDTMVVEATAAQTATLSTAQEWLLLEEIDGVDQAIIVGTWVPSEHPAQLNPTVVVITESGAQVEVTVSTSTASLIAHEREMDPHRAPQPLSRFRADVSRTRSGTSGDTDARSTTVVLLGDSLTEAYAPTARGLMWTRHLSRRLNGHRLGSVQYVPAAAGTFSEVTPASIWPASQAQWTYTGSVTGLVTHGPDLHAVTMASGATATFNFVGDTIAVVYTATTTGPAAAAVTIDGTAATAIDANNASELPGQQSVYTVTYGQHQIVITATGAPLVLEGASVHDNEIFGFGVPCRSVRTYAFGHAGFSTSDFVNRSNWDVSIANITANNLTGTYPSLVVVGLGANDFVFSYSAALVQSNLEGIMQRIDDAIDDTGMTATNPGFLLTAWPLLPDSYVSAMWRAAAAYDSDRVGVLDYRAFMPSNGSTLGIFDNAGHPNDAGQLWFANVLGDYIDDQSTVAYPLERSSDVIIEAWHPADGRVTWSESLSVLSSGMVVDISPSDAAVNERRHRVWLDRGTYQARLWYGEVTTTGGSAQVLVGSSSLGIQSTTGTTGNSASATMGSTVVIDSPGAYPVTVRCTTSNSAPLRFGKLHLRRTA